MPAFLVGAGRRDARPGRAGPATSSCRFGISFYHVHADRFFWLTGYRRQGRRVRSAPLRAVRYPSFPHLIAGPDHPSHREMMPQFARTAGRYAESAAVGRPQPSFVIGLFKKVVVADGYRARRRWAVQRRRRAGLSARLRRSLGPALSPMPSRSISTSLGIPTWRSALPRCSASVYRSISLRPTRPTSIIDFWQPLGTSRSLGSLRDYLYIPLGGKPGEARRGATRNLLVTMLLGGLWARRRLGPFVLWGGAAWGRSSPSIILWRTVGEPSTGWSFWAWPARLVTLRLGGSRLGAVPRTQAWRLHGRSGVPMAGLPAAVGVGADSGPPPALRWPRTIRCRFKGAEWGQRPARPLLALVLGPCPTPINGWGRRALGCRAEAIPQRALPSRHPAVLAWRQNAVNRRHPSRIVLSYLRVANR